MMETTRDKSVRRRPREKTTYPSMEALVQAHLEFARKSLEGVDLSFLKEKSGTATSKKSLHSPSSRAEKE